MYKILIVDDEPLIRDGLKQTLEIEDFNVETASNGTDAMETFDSFHPDLVITDIIMPEKDGIEIIWDIKEKFPDVKIIAISGGGRIAATDHLKIAKKLGANAILTKPFSTDELLLEIRKHLKD
jgi:YesN/AraC family two-component response regulator